MFNGSILTWSLAFVKHVELGAASTQETHFQSFWQSLSRPDDFNWFRFNLSSTLKLTLETLETKLRGNKSFLTHRIRLGGHSRRSKHRQVELKVPGWHHNSAKIFKLVRQCTGLMSSRLRIFRARSFLSALVVPKFTIEGRSVQPYSSKFVYEMGFPTWNVAVYTSVLKIT